MTRHDRNRPERRELTPDELNDVSGGVVCIPHPPEPCVPPGPTQSLGSSFLSANRGNPGPWLL